MTDKLAHELGANPFRAGGPIPVAHAVGRRRLLTELADRCRTGQSSAVVGDPRIGKSTVLGLLREALAPFEEVGVVALDGQGWTDNATAEDFWRRCCGEILGEQRWQDRTRSALAMRWPEAVQEALAAAGRRLVLLIDEFDAIASHPGIGGYAFGQQLRMVTHGYDRIAMVTASRQSLAELTRDFRWVRSWGSEPFNHFWEDTLGPFTDAEARTLLARGEPVLGPAVCAGLRAAAGNHPYLLQCGGYRAWWMAHSQIGVECCVRDSCERVQHATDGMMADLWSAWGPAQRRTYLAIAFRQAEVFVMPRDFVSFADLTLLQRRGMLVGEGLADARVPDGAMIDWALRKIQDWPPDEELVGDLDVSQRQRWFAWRRRLGPHRRV